jgi:hypothetical protein
MYLEVAVEETCDVDDEFNEAHGYDFKSNLQT